MGIDLSTQHLKIGVTALSSEKAPSPLRERMHTNKEGVDLWGANSSQIYALRLIVTVLLPA